MHAFLVRKTLELKSSELPEPRIFVVRQNLGGKPSIFVEFGRDSASFKKNALFEGLKIARWGSHGTRRNPQFYGAVAVVSRVRPDAVEEGVEYVELPDTPEARVQVSEVLERAESWEDVVQELTQWLKSLTPPAPTPAPEEVEEAEEAEEVEGVAPKVEIPEVKPRELEVELAPSVTTAVGLRAPEVPTRQELVRVYLLSMRLPSKYLVQKVVVGDREEVRKWEGLAAEVASRLEGIRRAAYDRVGRAFAYVEDYGTWIAVTPEAVKEVEEVSRWVREELSKLPLRQIKNVDIDQLYSVRAVPVYLEPEEARRLLEAAVRRLSEDVAELEKRIAEAESKKVLRRLQQDHQYRRALLEAFRKALERLQG